MGRDKSSERVFRQTDEVVRQISSQHNEKNVVSVGIRPSGIVHLGNLVTVILATWLTHKLGAHKSELIINICDFDRPDCSYGDTTPRSYRYMEDKAQCHESLAEHNSVRIIETLDQICSNLGVNHSYQNVSELQKTKGYRDLLKTLIIDYMKESKSILRGDSNSNKVCISPICSECHTITRKYARLKTRGEVKRVVAECNNPGCKVGEYDFNFDDSTQEFHIDPAMDIAIKNVILDNQVYVGGGDYLESNGETKTTRIQKIISLLDLISGTQSIFLIAPMVYGESGKKMSKSDNNGLTLDILKNYFPDVMPQVPWVERIIGFAKYLMDKQMTHVDYSVTRDYLLGGEFTRRM